MPPAEYEEILEILRSMPWDKIARRQMTVARTCAGGDSFVMGGVLSNPCFFGFREARVGKWGYHEKIVPAVLAKQASAALVSGSALR